MIPEKYQKNNDYVRVYFECDNWTCDRIAIFENEEEYDLCLPILENMAQQMGYDFVSESIGE